MHNFPRTFTLDTPDRLTAFSAFLTKQPLPLDVTVKPYVHRRSNSQNARLHLLFSKVAEATGNTLDSVKLGYKAKFLAGEQVEFHGQRFMVYPKTSKMDKHELNIFMEQVEADAATEFGVWID